MSPRPLLRAGRRCCAGLLSFTALACGTAEAACDVQGGGVVVNNSVVACSGASAPIIASGATGVSVTVLPGAVVDGGSGTAISLGNGALVDVQAGATLQNAAGGAFTLLVGKYSVVTVIGTVRNTGANQQAISGGEGTVVALHGIAEHAASVWGTFTNVDPTAYLLYAGSSLGYANKIPYISSAGHIDHVDMGAPLLVNAEVYNEAQGVIEHGITYLSHIYGAKPAIIVNRGLIGPDGQGNAISTIGLSSPQLRNEAGAIINGDITLSRGLFQGSAFGRNDGTINGTIRHYVPLGDGGLFGWTPAFGFDQRFDNYGVVASITLDSGHFQQHAGASFAADATLAPRGLERDSQGNPTLFLLSTLELEGAQRAACLQATYVGGQVAFADAAASLTIENTAPASCRFVGTLRGPGRLIKRGSGAQTVGTEPLPFNWTITRDPTNYSGGTSIVAGTLGVSASDALGSGGVSFDGTNATLRIDDGGIAISNALSFPFAAVLDSNGFDATLSGATGGSANVRKTGAGTLHWTGIKNHSGLTTVDGGVLRLPGALPGNVVVASGGALAGAAQIAGNTTVQNGGVLRPSVGVAAGVLLQTSALTMTAGATLRLVIDGGARDQIRTATATLGGVTLILDFAAPNAIGTQITLIDVTGASSALAPFAGLPEGSLVYQGEIGWRISYVGGNGNDITLTATVAPLTPQSITATPGDQLIALSFTPPAANAAGPITGYRAQCAPGAVIAEAMASPVIVGGLNNGVAYTCTLRTLTATAASAATAPLIATPRGPSSAPQQVVPVAGVAQFSVGFNTPSSNGGTPISGYQLACQPGNLLVQGIASPLGFSGLLNGTVYNCGLSAITEFGAGDAAVFSITPRTVPNAPTGLVATPYNASARFDFVAPAFDGGAPITNYTLRCPPGAQNTVTGATSPLWLSDLNNGNTYSGCTVRATNVAGNSVLSAAVSVTPLAVPSEIRNPAVVNSDGGSGVIFDTPLLGAPILDYTALCMPGTLSFTQAMSPMVLLPLSNGVAYTCAVSARNTLGSGPPISVEVRPSLDLFGDGFE